MQTTASAHLCFGGGFLACPIKLLMPGQDHDLGLTRTVAEFQQNFARRQHSSMSATHRINYLHASFSIGMCKKQIDTACLLGYDRSFPL